MFRFLVNFFLALIVYAVSLNAQYLSAAHTIHASLHIGGLRVRGDVCLDMISSSTLVSSKSFLGIFEGCRRMSETMP